jgi:hypothetical protein
MALTEIELVYAEAVDLIGEIELNENSEHTVKPYVTVARHYENARDEMIAGYNWNVATELALCLQDATTPPHTWAYRFTLPSDCLRTITTSRPKLDWRVMKGYVYTDYRIDPSSYSVGVKYYKDQYLRVDSVTYLIDIDFTATVWTTDISHCTTQVGDYGLIEIEYVTTLPDPSNWSVDLRNAIVLNLAAKIVVPITGDIERRKTIKEELHTLVIPHSIAMDAMQGKPKQFFYSDFTDSRGQ